MENSNNSQTKKKYPEDSKRKTEEKKEEISKNNEENKENQKKEEKKEEISNNKEENSKKEENLHKEEKLKKEEAEKKMEENKKNITNNQKIELKQKQNRIEEIEMKYLNLLKEINDHWEQGEKSMDEYYDKTFQHDIRRIFGQPCIIANQEVIVIIFRFLCQYFSFLKDKLKTINQKFVYPTMFLFNQEFNIFSKYPKIMNVYNDYLFDDKYELLGDNLFYYLLKQQNPEIEIQNPQVGGIYSNCMLKYLMEYLRHIGFLNNYICDFLSRDDLNQEYILMLTYYPCHYLNYSEDNFLINTDYKYNIYLLRNFTKYLKKILKELDNLIKANKNKYLGFIKWLNGEYWYILFGILGRALDEFEKRNMLNEVDDFLFSIYSFQEFLFKQKILDLKIQSITQLSTLALNYLDLSKELKKQFNDVEKVYEFTKKKFISFLQKMDIFNSIFGENIHEALIERFHFIFRFLYKNGCISHEQILNLWKISKSKYQSINNSIIKLFGIILPEFSSSDVNLILNYITNIPFKEVNSLTLKLLENFFLSKERNETLLKILFQYSNELNYYKGLSCDIIKESRKILMSLLFNKNYHLVLVECFKNCLFCLDNNYMLNLSRFIFFEIINEFSHCDQKPSLVQIIKLLDDKINNFQNLVQFLDEKYSFYSIIMNNLLFYKKIFFFFYVKNLYISKNYMMKETTI